MEEFAKSCSKKQIIIRTDNCLQTAGNEEHRSKERRDHIFPAGIAEGTELGRAMGLAEGKERGKESDARTIASLKATSEALHKQTFLFATPARLRNLLEYRS